MLRSTPRSAVVSTVIPATLPRLRRPRLREVTLATRLGRRVYATLGVLLTLATLGGTLVFAAPSVPTALPASTVSISGLTTSGGGWLCRTWRYDGYTWTHCTHEWHISGGSLISDNPAWVPNTATVVASPYVPSWVWQDARAALANGGNAQPLVRTTDTSSPQPSGAPICQWCYTGLSAHGNSDPSDVSGNPSARSYPLGQCTWLAAYLAPTGQDFAWLGNAWEWANSARAHGLPTGSAPQVGATAVFAPGDQGASSLGHVAHVVQVFSGGWFLVEEMNFFWNGGGFNLISYRYARADGAVQFIY